ncbi:MAG: ATP-dependent helicase [Bacteroidetes bacterium]|nr:MAG: ATP-dependent helicase [Bacteroidota bacterium]
MFTQAVSKEQVVDVVYNLYELEKELYLPDAYVVTRDQIGLLAHIKQKATAATIGAFQLELNEVRKQLFRIIDELQPDAIARHFHQGKRKPPALESMLEDREVFKAIQHFVHRRLDTMLRLIVKHELPLSWQVDRRGLVMDFVVATAPHPLEPQLYFHKTDDSVQYRLRLFEDGQEWDVRSKEVVAITNLPTGWICADLRLYQLNHINGFLVKPFRHRDEVTIPAASVNAYFRTFIMKIVNKVEVEAEGFEVVQYDSLQACTLEPVQHLFENRWLLAVKMQYQGSFFGWNESRQRRTSLEIKEDEVRILQVRRDQAAEVSYLEVLKKFPLQQTESLSHFELTTAADNPFALLEWLANNRDALETAGFTIDSPEVDNRSLQLHLPRITLEVGTGSDWFDLKGEIVVGAHRFPFLALAKYIRENNRFYPLPDGSCFLIPEEWMARYKQLVDFGKKEGQTLRITKSQYTLLEVLDLPQPAELEADQLPEYVPSPLLKAQLRPYQLEGIRWLVNLYHQELGGCLADDMGLGKTLQTIAMLLYAKEQRAKKRQGEKETGPNLTTGNQLGLFAPAEDEAFLQPLNTLIVLPSSLVFNWESELKKFVPTLSVYQHFGPKRHKDPRLLARFDVILTTYQTALRDVDLLQKIDFEYIILDESQQIKNRESKVFKALNNLQANHKLSLSGTPIENSLSDLWAQMQFINEGLLGSFNFFRNEFILPIERGQDEEKKDKLRKLVKPYLLRRTKEEVAKDLPPLSTHVFYTEMTTEQRKVYEREKSSARNYLLDNFNSNNSQYRMLVVQTLTKLRQLVNHPVLVNPDYDKGSGKYQDILEQWEVIQRSGHKVLLFSSFVKHLELFRQELERRGAPYAWLTGDLTQAKRKAAIQSFQEDPAVQSFLISIKTGGTGLNLTAADYVFILDPWWNPTTEQQAIARAHRIGQKNNVIALKFITKDSIEEKILKLQDRKLQLAEDILGAGGKLALDRGDIEFLLS